MYNWYKCKRFDQQGISTLLSIQSHRKEITEFSLSRTAVPDFRISSPVSPLARDGVGRRADGRGRLLRGPHGLHHRGYRVHGQSPGGEIALQLSGTEEDIHHDASETREERRDAIGGHVQVAGKLVGPLLEI